MARKPKETAAVAPAPVAAPAEKPPVVKQPEQHGVTRPKEGTQTGKVWTTIDAMLVDGVIPRRKDVIARLTAEGMNPATVSTQYGKYRKFHGLGPEPKEVEPEAPVPVAPNAEEGMPEELPEEEILDNEGDPEEDDSIVE